MINRDYPIHILQVSYNTTIHKRLHQVLAMYHKQINHHLQSDKSNPQSVLYIYIFIMCSIGCTELNLVYKRDVNGDLESVIYASELDEVKWHASGMLLALTPKDQVHLHWCKSVVNLMRYKKPRIACHPKTHSMLVVHIYSLWLLCKCSAAIKKGHVRVYCVALQISSPLTSMETALKSHLLCAITFCVDFFPSCSSPPHFPYPV